MRYIKDILCCTLMFAALDANTNLINKPYQDPKSELIQTINQESERIKTALAQAYFEEMLKKKESRNGARITVKTKKENLKDSRTGKISSRIIDKKVTITLDNNFFESNRKIDISTGDKKDEVITLDYKKNSTHLKQKKISHKNMAKKLQLLQEDEVIAEADIREEKKETIDPNPSTIESKTFEPATEPQPIAKPAYHTWNKVHFVDLTQSENQGTIEAVTNTQPNEASQEKSQNVNAAPTVNEPIQIETNEIARSEPQVAYEDNICPVDPCSADYFIRPPRCSPLANVLFLGYTFGKGIDTHKNYWSADYLYYPIQKRYDYAPFVYLGANLLENSRWGGNFGAGVRIDWDRDWIWGVNAFYDSFKSIGTFQQFGLGYEILSNTWELRANVYFPVGQKRFYGKTHLYDNFVGGYYIKTRKFETAERGFDLEIGRNFYFWNCFRSFVGIGPACFVTNHSDHRRWAFKARGLVQWSDYVTLEVRTYKESNQNWNWQGVITLSWPLEYCLDCFKDCCENSLNNLFARPVYRNRFVKTKNDCCWQTNY